MQTEIFDLDGTVIDTSHRYRSLEDGTLDLDYWIENSTPSKILLDKEMPLAQHMRDCVREGKHVIICTARYMQAIDYQWLREHNLFAHRIFYNDTLRTNDKTGGALKLEQLAPLNLPVGTIFWEDKKSIRELISAATNITCLHPEDYIA